MVKEKKKKEKNKKSLVGPWFCLAAIRHELWFCPAFVVQAQSGAPSRVLPGREMVRFLCLAVMVVTHSGVPLFF